jgi:hypothetical protein
VQRNKGELMQSVDPHPILTLVLSIWAGVGPLVGLLVGHYLIRSWQREQWLLDSRKQEFRELLSAITSAHVEHISCTTFRDASSYDLKVWKEAEKRAFQVIADRIYIAEDVEQLRIKHRFGNMTDDDSQFHSELRQLTLDIVEVAKRG